MAERTRPRENERKRRLDFSAYTPNLTNKILSLYGKKQVEPDIPDSTLAAFQQGSLIDRDMYWQEHAKEANFGLQMAAWLGIGKPGMTQWIEKQTDEDTIRMLGAVGLRSSREQTQNDLHEPAVASLIATADNDLQKIGQGRPILQGANENDAFARSLIFYTKYLNPHKDSQGEESRQLIDTLLDAASQGTNGDTEAIKGNLKKIGPLFELTGEEGQHTLAALTIAKSHAVNALDIVKAVPADASLNDQESHVLDFLQRNEQPVEGIPVEPLQPGESQRIADVFGALTPDATPNHRYWVKAVPDHFAQNLTAEQLTSLLVTQPFWLPDGEINREVFDDASLVGDKRFARAQALTNKDSGIFALAAASAQTPEEQAKLYQALGETILHAHTDNPDMLKHFLEAQNDASKMKFADNDYQRASAALGQQRELLEQQLEQEFQAKFGRPYQMNDPKSDEEQAFIQDRYGELALPIQTDILGNVAKFPDRLVALTLQQGGEQQFGTPMPQIDIDKTIASWPDRIPLLEKALHDGSLTIEQIRQIEFLGHSINIAKTISLMQSQITRRTGPDESAQVAA